MNIPDRDDPMWIGIAAVVIFVSLLLTFGPLLMWGLIL